MRRALCSLLLLMSIGRGAHALSPDSELQKRTFAVEFSAGSNCQNRAAFVQEILARAPNAQEVEASDANVRFSVELYEANNQIAGVLQIRPREGESTTRQVPPAACAEVVRTLALIAAVVLDARLRYAESATEAPSEIAPAPSTNEAQPSSSFRARPGIVAQGMLESNFAPNIGVGAALGAELWFDTSRIISPSVRLLGSYVQSGTEETRYGDASFHRLALRLAACPVRLPAESEVAFRPCALFDVGQLTAEGTNTDAPKKIDVLWLALGASARIEWALRPWAGLEFEAGALAPTSHDRFLFDPNLVVHEIDPIGFFFNFNGILRFR